MLQNARYGEDSDQIGILRLTQNKTISTAYPLHEVSVHGGRLPYCISVVGDYRIVSVWWETTVLYQCGRRLPYCISVVGDYRIVSVW